MHDKKPSPGGRWRGEAVTDEGKGFDIRVLPSKQVKAFAPQVRRWHGAAMTDEGGSRRCVGHRRADTEVRPYKSHRDTP